MSPRMTFQRLLAPLRRELHSGVLELLHSFPCATEEESREVLALLLQASLERTSFESVARRYPAWSPTWSRKLLAELCGQMTAAELEGWVNGLLRELWAPRLRGQHLQVVGDETHLPFWGRQVGSVAGALRGGPPKNGAVRFFAYVTLVGLWRGHRVVLALGRWLPQEPLAAVLERLGRPLLDSGLRIESWSWDRGGATVAMLHWWQDQQQPFVVAAPRRGAKTGVAARLAALEAEHGFSRRQPPPVAEPYTLHPEKGSGLAPVTVTLVVGWERVKKGTKERRQRSARRSRVRPGQHWRAVAWFTDGRGWRGRGGAVKECYRRRQSIESSYRMSHAVRARTSSRDSRWRLLLFALSQLLQAIWVWLSIRGPASPSGGRGQRPMRALFADLCAALCRRGMERFEERWPPIAWDVGGLDLTVLERGV